MTRATARAVEPIRWRPIAQARDALVRSGLRAMLSNQRCGGLPIVVGVTGHRDVRPEDTVALERAVDAIFSRLANDYRTTPLLLLTPLAEGADRLVARVARRRAIPFRVPMPMPMPTYREDFRTPESRAEFDELLGDASGTPYAMPFYGDNDARNLGDETRRGHQYALLDAHLVRAAHLLVALWDGVVTDTIAGTAQAVRFRVLGVPERYVAKPSLIDAPETGPVYHLYTPRVSTSRPTREVGTSALLVGRERSPGAHVDGLASDDGTFARIVEALPGTADPFEALYGRIETFNRDCASVAAPAGRTDDDASATQSLRFAAERVASRYQRKHVTALQRLFVTSAVAATTFEVYAHLFPHVRVLVAVYGVAFAVAVGTFVRARRGRWQDRAQDYRALEIGLNVQHVWDAAGLDESVADYYIRRQRTELDWIRDAIRTARDLDRGRDVDEARAIATIRTFVGEQHAYFESRTGAGRTSETSKSERYATLSRRLLRLSFVLSALLVVFGLVAWIRPALLHDVPIDTWQDACIVAVAIAAIAAALFNDYATRRAYAQHVRRYSMMASLYGRARDVLDASETEPARPQSDDAPSPSRIAIARRCAFEIGHEALIENGDWLVLHRDLPIELLPVA